MIKLKKKERKRPSRYVAGQLVTAIHNKRWEENETDIEKEREKRRRRRNERAL